MSEPVTIQEYTDAIPECCEYKDEKAQREILMHCWGLLNAINKGENMDCSGCEFNTAEFPKGVHR